MDFAFGLHFSGDSDTHNIFKSPTISQDLVCGLETVSSNYCLLVSADHVFSVITTQLQHFGKELLPWTNK